MKKGLAVGYWDANEFRRLDRLATRAIQSIAKFQRYLRSPQTRRNADRYRPTGPIESNDPNESDPNENDPNENDPNDSNDPNV